MIASSGRSFTVQHVPTNTGWIEVICGSMFSGKTEELIRRVRRAQFARQRVQLFKPALDDRYSRTAILSHDRRTLDCTPLLRIGDIYRHLDRDTDVVGLDEAQFFDDTLVRVCEDLAARGLRVIAAALDQDYLGRPFGAVPRLLCVAEYVTKSLAICVRCGNPANRSQRLRGGRDTVQVGAEDSYEPRCRSCFRPAVIGQEEMAVAGGEEP